MLQTYEIIVQETELLQQVRNTVTLDGGIPVYADANIDLLQFDPTDVYPTALYVLQEHLDRLLVMYNVMREFGVDILNLQGIYNYADGIVIAPPLVELCDGVPAIVDGIHRFYLAGALGKPVTAIYVEGANPDYPLVSYPVSWEEVNLYQSRPTDPKLLRKVRYGIEDTSEGLRKYYRDLKFLGSSGRRPRKEQNG